MSLSERVQQINREISATVERALSGLREEVSQRLRSSHEEVLRRLDEITPELPGAYLADQDIHPVAEQMASAAAAVAGAVARHNAFVEARDAIAAIDRSRSQAEILAALLRESSRFASRAAVLLLRGDELRGWGGQGFGEAEPGIRELALPASDGSPWGRLAQAQGAERLNAAECAALCSRIEAPLPHDGLLVPLVLRDRIAAALYADRLDGDLAVEALQVLCNVAAQAIELLPFRDRPFTPTLNLEGDGAASPTVSEPAPAPVPVPEPEPATEPEAAPEVVPEASSAPAEPEPAVAAEPELPELEAEPEPVPSPWAFTPAEPEAEAEVETLSDVEAIPEELPEEPAPASEPARFANIACGHRLPAHPGPSPGGQRGDRPAAAAESAVRAGPAGASGSNTAAAGASPGALVSNTATRAGRSRAQQLPGQSRRLSGGQATERRRGSGLGLRHRPRRRLAERRGAARRSPPAGEAPRQRDQAV